VNGTGLQITFRGPPPLNRSTGKVPSENITEGDSIICTGLTTSSIFMVKLAALWSNLGERRKVGCEEN